MLEYILITASAKHVYMLWRCLGEEAVEHCRAYEPCPTGYEQNLAVIVFPYHDEKEFTKATS